MEFTEQTKTVYHNTFFFTINRMISLFMSNRDREVCMYNYCMYNKPVLI